MSTGAGTGGYAGFRSSARFASPMSTMSASRNTRDTRGSPAISNVPTLKGSAISISGPP